MGLELIEKNVIKKYEDFHQIVKCLPASFMPLEAHSQPSTQMGAQI